MSNINSVPIENKSVTVQDLGPQASDSFSNADLPNDGVCTAPTAECPKFDFSHFQFPNFTIPPPDPTAQNLQCSAPPTQETNTVKQSKSDTHDTIVPSTLSEPVILKTINRQCKKLGKRHCKQLGETFRIELDKTREHFQTAFEENNNFIAYAQQTIDQLRKQVQQLAAQLKAETTQRQDFERRLQLLTNHVNLNATMNMSSNNLRGSPSSQTRSSAAKSSPTMSSPTIWNPFGTQLVFKNESIPCFDGSCKRKKNDASKTQRNERINRLRHKRADPSPSPCESQNYEFHPLPTPMDIFSFFALNV